MIRKLTGISSVEIRVEKFMITALIILNAVSIESNNFENQIEVAVENYFLIFGRSESLNRGVYKNTNIFLSLDTGEFENNFVSSNIVGSTLCVEGKTDQFCRWHLISNIKLIGDIRVSLVDDENGWSDARNDVAFSKGLSLRGLGIEFWSISFEVGRKRILEFVDGILIILTVEVVGVRNLFSFFALLAQWTAE